MTPLPVINDVFRVTLNWGSVDGVTPRNVLHFRMSGGDEGDLANKINGAWGSVDPSHLFNVLSDDVECSTVDILKLDGSSATQQLTMADPITGGAGTGDIIPQACAIVTFRTGQRGPRGRGRVYAGPITEAAQAGGVIDGSRITTMHTQWTDFINDMKTGALQADLVVASYVHADAHDVLSSQVQAIAGTQRRRIDQLR